MRILLVGDVHGEMERLDDALGLVAGEGFALALLAGDIGIDPPASAPARSRDRAAHDGSVRAVIERVRQAAETVVFVPGNHDLPEAADDTGAVNADGRLVAACGLRIAGLGGAGPDRFGFAYEWSEEQADAALDAARSAEGALDVLLCHAPPSGSALDLTARGKHVGSAAVDRCLAQARPRLFVCGHIHEAWGFEQHRGVPCVNAGALGVPYAQSIVFTIEWDGGPRSIACLRRPAPEAPVEHLTWDVG